MLRVISVMFGLGFEYHRGNEVSLAYVGLVERVGAVVCSGGVYRR